MGREGSKFKVSGSACRHPLIDNFENAYSLLQPIKNCLLQCTA